MMTFNEFMKEMSWKTVVKPNTKKAQSLINEYYYASKNGIRDVRHAYDSCSDAKKESFDEIERRAFHQDADCVYIAGHNCMSYSTIYKTKIIDTNGAILTVIVKDTRDNTYVTMF